MNFPARLSAQEPSSSPGAGPIPTVTIVICTRGRAADLEACLAAVARLSPPPTEVLVVDNSEGDALTEQTARRSGARYLTEPAKGLSRARNRGIRESSTEIVAFLDDDAVPCEDWLGQILVPFADERVAVVTGDTLPSRETMAESRARPVRLLSNENPLWFEMANFGGLGFGTNMALRRKDCSAPGFFDVRLGRGALIWIAEESHAYTQLLARGLHAAHVPAAVVVHPDKPRDVRQEATASFAYWLLLFFDFPRNRRDLVGFLTRRLQRKPLSWPRYPSGPGEIISSSWWLKMKASIAGVMLYLRARHVR